MCLSCINIQKNTIEVSTNSGRTWNTRFSGTNAGKFIDLLAYGNEILACTSKGVFSSFVVFFSDFTLIRRNK